MPLVWMGSNFVLNLPLRLAIMYIPASLLAEMTCTMIIVANHLGTLDLSPILVPYDLALSQNNSVFSFPVWLQSGNGRKERACVLYMYMLAEFSGCCFKTT